MHVKWFQEHLSRNCKPVEIWYSDLFKTFGPASFMIIPMECIQETCITCEVSINDEIVTAVNPISKKLFI